MTDKLKYIPSNRENIFGKRYTFGCLKISDDDGHISLSCKYNKAFILLYVQNAKEPYVAVRLPYGIDSCCFDILKELMNDIEEFLQEDPFHKKNSAK